MNALETIFPALRYFSITALGVNREVQWAEFSQKPISAFPTSQALTHNKIRTVLHLRFPQYQILPLPLEANGGYPGQGHENTALQKQNLEFTREPKACEQADSG